MVFTLICGTTTLNRPDSTAEPESLAVLPRLPRDAGGPVFAEPWQAEAFALAVRLSAQGCFSWKEWAAALAEELAAATQQPTSATQHSEADAGSIYYQCWLTALERLVVAKGLADPASLLAQKQAWAEAYRTTPHGLPVELRNTSAR
ncbi:MAG: nitrile hydratase accessory protein [Gammaproteobacteria bacterium]|nr:nitrile hydratase accessory protein [Gammaproteobacteria bacterium]